MGKYDDRKEDMIQHNPENDCVNCYKKKYCKKDCRAKKNFEKVQIEEAIAKMQGEQKIKEALGQNTQSNGLEQLEPWQREALLKQLGQRNV